MTSRKTELDHLDRQAQTALNSLYAESHSSGRKAGRQSSHSWKAVAGLLGFNAGYLYRVANGEKKASNTLLVALHLPPREALAPVCPKCGVVHSRTCRILPEWVNQAADWLAERRKASIEK